MVYVLQVRDLLGPTIGAKKSFNVAKADGQKKNAKRINETVIRIEFWI